MKQNPPPKFEVSKKRFWTTNKIVPGMIFRFLFELQLQPAPWRKDGYDHLQVVNQQGGGWMLKSKGSARFLRPAILLGAIFSSAILIKIDNPDLTAPSAATGPLLVSSAWPQCGNGVPPPQQQQPPPDRPLLLPPPPPPVRSAIGRPVSRGPLSAGIGRCAWTTPSGEPAGPAPYQVPVALRAVKAAPCTAAAS